MNLKVPGDFWEPIRAATVRNTVGYVPILNSRGVVIAPPEAVSNKPIVTYISRQGGGRKLLPADHDSLVEALEELEWDGLCDVHIPMMEKMSLKEQIELVAKSTVREIRFRRLYE